MKKLLRNLLLPKNVLVVSMSKKGRTKEKRAFLDDKTMLRWIGGMKDMDWHLDGVIESIPILVNNKGN